MFGKKQIKTLGKAKQAPKNQKNASIAPITTLLFPAENVNAVCLPGPIAIPQRIAIGHSVCAATTWPGLWIG